ncbi:MAG: adenosylhomocysteinase [Candidatus Diapherotrites archaeon]|nr:adenosylhomocysteinase [Candidatus Diapherotrites archaeon]
MSDYSVKDISLAKQGLLKIGFAESQMQALLEVRKEFERNKPLKGQRVGMALHVTKETAVLVRTLVAGGAKVAITGCNPLSTQDDVAAALASEGIAVFAHKGESREEYYEFLNKVLDFKPTITIDDGCDLVSEIHLKRKELLDTVVAGTEETTTGVIRLRAMEKDKALKYPVVAVNDNKTKHLFDNYYGTGQSTLDGILRATNVLFAGKKLVVCGYGSCGKGVSTRARGMGANVTVAEVDALAALQAKMDGFEVKPLAQALLEADIVITVTGNKHVVQKEHFSLMKSGVILANAGHFDVEIDAAGLKSIAVKMVEVRPSLEEFTLKNGRKIFLCAQGRLVNLAAAEGHPSEVMSMSFCGQALAVKYALEKKLPAGVHVLPSEVDEKIARLQLAALGVQIDSLTKEQEKYLGSWTEGT